MPCVRLFGDLKCRFKVWVGPETAFLTSFQVMLKLLGW